jgi:hypothetical protein
MARRSSPPPARKSSPLHPIIVGASALRDSAHTLDQIRAVEEIRSDANTALTLLIVRARAEGLSWAAIGGAAGMSAQAAQKRASP